MDILNKLWRQFKRIGSSLRWNVEQKIVPAIGSALVGVFVTYIVDLLTNAVLSTFILTLVFTIVAVLTYSFNSRVMNFVDLVRLWKCAWSDVNSLRLLALHADRIERRQLAVKYLIETHEHSYDSHKLFITSGMYAEFPLYERLIQATARVLVRNGGKPSFKISASSLVSPQEVLRRKFYMRSWVKLYNEVGWNEGQVYRILIPETPEDLTNLIDADKEGFRRYLRWHLSTGFEMWICRQGISSFKASKPMLALNDFAVFGSLAVLGAEDVKDGWNTLPRPRSKPGSDEEHLVRQLYKVGIQYDTNQYQVVLDQLKTDGQVCMQVDLRAGDMGVASIRNFLRSA